MKKYLALIAYTFLFTSFSIVQSAEAPKVKQDTTNTGSYSLQCNFGPYSVLSISLLPIAFPYEIITKCSIERINVVKDNNGK